MAGIHKIADINPTIDNLCVRIRVIRLWTLPSYENSPLSYSIEMGGKIHASVKKAFVSRFVNLLEEGISYQIRYFGVGLNKGYFKTTYHEYVVNLNQRTDVHRLPESSSIPRHGFKFVSFDTLNAPGYDCTYLVDVVGYLAEIENEKTLEKNGKSTKYTVIELDIDDGYRIKLGVIDNSDCACFVVFDKEAKQVLGKSCNLLLEFSNEVAANDESELLENAITPTKRLSSKSEESKHNNRGNSSDGSNDVHFQSVLSNITNGLNTENMFKKLISRVILLDNNPTPYRSRSPTTNLHYVGEKERCSNISDISNSDSLEYSNRIRLQRDARLNRKTMLLQKRHGASTSNSNLDTKELEEMCIAEKGRHLRQRKTFLKELAINLSKIFEEVEDITENTTILDDSVQIEYPAIFDVAENTDVIDIDDQEFFCRHCYAMMWYEERSEKSKTGSNIEFSICCMRGKVQLPFLQRPPQLLQGLISGADQRSKHFKDNIRTYNSMFCFTSLGGKIETSINDGTGPPQFIVSGQNYHRIGSLVPIEGQRPKFAQLYIYDTENEVSNRIEIFSSRTNNNNIDQSLVLDLKDMIDQHNVLAHTFRIVRNYLNQGDIANIRLRLYRKRSKDARVYNLPSSNEVAALIVGDFDSGDAGRDIIVQLKSGHLQRIHETHTAFIPLQYPMMFPYGKDDYQEDIPLRESHRADENRKRQRVSLREFIAFRIQERKVEYATIVNGGRLFQQFLVDCFSMIEAQRLTYY
ncbi:uncharacterized protein [Arachis hypogaea]|uniref:uncharacterized protein n=1 Tax=Arachis hypogaea TaxID=3818 RepID=UPI003B20C836